MQDLNPGPSLLIDFKVTSCIVTLWDREGSFYHLGLQKSSVTSLRVQCGEKTKTELEPQTVPSCSKRIWPEVEDMGDCCGGPISSLLWRQSVSQGFACGPEPVSSYLRWAGWSLKPFPKLWDPEYSGEDPRLFYENFNLLVIFVLFLLKVLMKSQVSRMPVACGAL